MDDSDRKRIALISGHAPLFKTISISLVAGRLIFKGSKKIFPNVNGTFCNGSRREPLKSDDIPVLVELFLRYRLEKRGMTFDSHKRVAGFRKIKYQKQYLFFPKSEH